MTRLFRPSAHQRIPGQTENYSYCVILHAALKAFAWTTITQQKVRVLDPPCTWALRILEFSKSISTIGAMFATRNKCIASSNKCLTSSSNVRY